MPAQGINYYSRCPYQHRFLLFLFLKLAGIDGGAAFPPVAGEPSSPSVQCMLAYDVQRVYADVRNSDSGQFIV